MKGGDFNHRLFRSKMMKNNKIKTLKNKRNKIVQDIQIKHLSKDHCNVNYMKIKWIYMKMTNTQTQHIETYKM